MQQVLLTCHQKLNLLLIKIPPSHSTHLTLHKLRTLIRSLIKLTSSSSLFTEQPFPGQYSEQAVTEFCILVNQHCLSRMIRIINEQDFEDCQHELAYLSFNLDLMFQTTALQCLQVCSPRMVPDEVMRSQAVAEQLRDVEIKFIVAAMSCLESEGSFGFCMNYVGKSILKRKTKEAFYKHLPRISIQQLKRIFSLSSEGVGLMMTELKQPSIAQVLQVQINVGIKDFSTDDIKANRLLLVKQISSKKIPIQILFPQKQEQGIESLDRYSSIMIYFAGGGFIASTHEVSQFFLRPFCQQLNLPVISTIYRKAPQHPFPAGLNDAFKTYLYFRQKYPRKNIIVGGDSAGGNFTCAMTTLCLENGVTLPDSLLLIYPAMRLQLHYTPSLLLTLDTNVLTLPAMKLILEHYITDADLLKHPLVSPCYTKQWVKPELISAWPPTLCILGGRDGLLDDGLRGCEWMKRCTRKVFKDMPHGFLGLEGMGMNEVVKAKEMIIGQLRRMVK